MKKKLCASCLMTFLFLSPGAFAHDILEGEYDIAPIIDDLDAIANLLGRENISNGDVVMVSAITCSTMRVSARERFGERMTDLLNANYPSPDKVQEIDIKEFIEFEQDTFRDFDATPEAIDFVTQAIEENPTLPENSPVGARPLSADMATIEEISCMIRTEPAAALDLPDDQDEQAAVLAATATPERSSLARSMGKAVIGTATAVGDAIAGGATAAETGGATAVLAAISIGWGWNRVEEAYFEILEFWNSR